MRIMSPRCSQTLVDLFECGAYLNPEGIAVIYDDGNEKQIMTYGQLVSAVQRVCDSVMCLKLTLTFKLTLSLALCQFSGVVTALKPVRAEEVSRPEQESMFRLNSFNLLPLHITHFFCN